MQSIQHSLRSKLASENVTDWRERWNHPDPDHVLPKLNKRDSVVFLSSVLDLYGRLVNGYDRMLRPRDGGDYGGCTLRNMFDIDAFLRGANRYVQPFLKEFVTTQLFSNLIRSRIECSTLTSTSLSLLDFPILFFDKYLMLMSQPSQARVNHLYRVLYQRSNRILLLSISAKKKDSGCSLPSLSTSVSGEQDATNRNRLLSSVAEWWRSYPSIVTCLNDSALKHTSLGLCGGTAHTLPDRMVFSCCYVYCDACCCCMELGVRLLRTPHE